MEGLIAQGLVTAMGGRIRVTSKEGSGSSFVFAIPTARRSPGAERVNGDSVAGA